MQQSTDLAAESQFNITMAVAIALGVVLLSVFIGETLPLMMIDLQKQMDINLEQTSLIRFVPGTAGLLIAPSAGSLADRLGSKLILTVSFVLVCCGCLVIALSGNISNLIIGMLILGVGLMASTITGYTMLTKVAVNDHQQTLFIAAWGIVANIGYIVFPPIGGWILIHSARGWTSISLLWMVAYFALLLLCLFVIKEKKSETLVSHQKIEWSWLINGGIILSLTSAIPVFDVLNPSATPLLLMLEVAVCVVFCWQISHSRKARKELKFLSHPGVIFALLALAATYLVDWNYFSERFLSLRYSLPLHHTASWLIPANFAGLAGASLFGTISLRAGVKKTTSLGLIFWIITSFIFLLISIHTPIWVAAVSVASFTMIEALVFSGLQATATALVPKISLGAFVSLMVGLNTIFKSIGGALTGDVMMNIFKDSLRGYISPLPLSNELTDKIVQWISEGNYHLALEGELKIPAIIVDNHIRKGALSKLLTYINCLHALGYLCLAMIVISAALYVGCSLQIRWSKELKFHNL